MKPRVFASPHFWPITILAALCTLYWSAVLFSDRVLLPGEYLRGFAPFGGDASAPWNLLRWDALGQYYPWRLLAARELRAGHIPLWNPHQFAGAPFVANGQSAVFYPLNLVFWIFDVARAFAISAWLHSLLAALGTYALAQRWKLSRGAAVFAAIAFTFGGYLTSWVMLPTLANTASWLPLCVLLFERASKSRRDFALFSLAFACALLAGHAQVFFYIGCALLLRALTLPQPNRALKTLALGSLLTLALAAIQVLPTLELARLGNRAGQGGPSAQGWNFVAERALSRAEWNTLFLPGGPFLSFSENFGYIGIIAALFAIIAILLAPTIKSLARGEFAFAAILAIFGLAYALASPLAKLFYFVVPGLSQMGGTGRAFVLWNGGIALLAAFGFDFVRAKIPAKVRPKNGVLFAAVALFLLTAELFAASWNLQPGAPRASIYPDTELTQFLQLKTRDGSRVLFLTPRKQWGASEDFIGSTRTHPPGVLPPNGAMIYGLNDVNGYDSLAPRAYREFVASYEVDPTKKDGKSLHDKTANRESDDPSPPRNGNMLLLQNPDSPSLDALGVRWVVSQTPLDAKTTTLEIQLDGCYVYSRAPSDSPKFSGADFSPGWKNGKYQPESFRCGTFVSLCALALVAFLFGSNRISRITQDESG